MNERGKSDSPIVPRKSSNNDPGAPRSAEETEGRGLAKGNPPRQTRCRTQGRIDLQQALGRIRQAAVRDRRQRFTALWHHVYSVERLREAYFSLKSRAAPGVDGQTWQEYGENLEANLQRLSERLPGSRVEIVRSPHLGKKQHCYGACRLSLAARTNPLWMATRRRTFMVWPPQQKHRAGF